MIKKFVYQVTENTQASDIVESYPDYDIKLDNIQNHLDNCKKPSSFELHIDEELKKPIYFRYEPKDRA